MRTIELWTDGSCKKNGQKGAYGGWGAVMIDEEIGEYRACGREEATTNNIMEMTSVYIVYASDDWGARKGIVGIYTNKAIAIDHIIDYYRENTDLTESELQEARFQLNEFYQTQGITKADNFEIDIKSLNEWDW